MTGWLLRIWRPLHALPWALAEVCIRYAVTSAGIGLVIWHIAADDRWLIYVILGALLIFAVGPDALARASSLLNALKKSYRRTLIRLTWSSTMQRAKLYETVHVEDSLHSLKTTPGGRKVPKLKRFGRNRIRYTPCGIALTVDGSNIGAGTAAFDGDQAAVLKAKWRARDLIVSEHPERPYLTQLRLIFTDPFAVTLRPSQLPPPPYPPTGICTVGKDSDGAWVTKDARRANLIAGSPGAGKSSECWELLDQLVRQALPFRTRVYDPKGGQEFFDLGDKAYRYESDPTKWCEFLEEALSAMATRQAALKAKGKRKWTPELAVEFPELFPLDMMIIDELVTVIAMMAGADNKVTINGKKVPALKAFMVYLSQIRAAGFGVIACTQLAQKEAIGIIRDLFAYTTCLRVGSDEMVRTILGDAKLFPAHEIPVGDDFAGIGYMQDLKSGKPIKYRAVYLDDDERAEVARAIGLLTAQQRATATHTKGGPITLDIGDDVTLDVTEEEQAAMNELLHTCVKCQAEFNDDFQAELNRLVEERVHEMNGAHA